MLAWKVLTMMTLKKKTKRGRDIGTMTDPVIADIVPPPPLAEHQPVQRVPYKVPPASSG